jgi:cytidylate kinase
MSERDATVATEAGDRSSILARMQAVTISREYGSGGGEIAARLARRLGWQLVDHQIVAEVADTLGETVAEAAQRDEHAAGFVAKVVDGLQWVAPWSGWQPAHTADEDQRRHFEALRRVVGSVVEIGHVVIVGRGAQAMLADRRDVLHVRIVAPLDRRVGYVAAREGLTAEAAQERIRRKDQDRAHYLQAVQHRRPDDPHLYDAVLNTAVLSLDQVVEIAIALLAAKSERLALPETELGPGAGLSPYPAPPEELQLPADEG